MRNIEQAKLLFLFLKFAMKFVFRPKTLISFFFFLSFFLFLVIVLCFGLPYVYGLTSTSPSLTNYLAKSLIFVPKLLMIKIHVHD